MNQVKLQPNKKWMFFTLRSLLDVQLKSGVEMNSHALHVQPQTIILTNGRTLINTLRDLRCSANICSVTAFEGNTSRLLTLLLRRLTQEKKAIPSIRKISPRVGERGGRTRAQHS